MLRKALVLGSALIIGSALGVEGHAVPPTAQAELVNAEGMLVGRATFTQLPDGVLIKVLGANLPPGTHALHIHERAVCDPPGFTTAGGHFNPFGRQHGLKNPNGPHAGDLPNVTVQPNGSLQFETVAKLVTLGDGPNSLFKEGGTSLMIHAGPDDDVSDPAGNAGARIACGPIKRMR